MATKQQQKSFKEKLLTTYRIIFINEDTLKETPFIKFNKLRVWIFVIISLLAFSVIFIYTALFQNIEGFSEIEMKKKILTLSFQVDSLEQKIQDNDKYFQSIQRVLKGDALEKKFTQHSTKSNAQPQDFQEIKPIREDSLLRQSVAEEEKFNVFNKAEKKQKVTVFFPPIQGGISSFFNASQKHFGIDISAKNDSPIMAVADGTIIFSEWTIEHGFVIIIEHNLGFNSVYKNIYLPNNKKQGDQVKAGEVIANLTSSDGFDSKPYLHFELWENGYPVNPKNYIQLK